MQIGVMNEKAAAKARKAGLEVVQDRCVKIEHGRLFGGLNWVRRQYQDHLRQAAAVAAVLRRVTE